MNVRYTYDSWGKIISVNDTSGRSIGTKNPFRYRGYYYDEESGLYYLGSRYYDPEVGRFLNADGVINGNGESVFGYNLYAYCFNNPVNMSDSNGNWPKLLEEIRNRFKNTIVVMVKIATAPFKAVSASVGMGIGIGVNGTAKIKNLKVDIGASTSITDSICYDKGKVDIKNTTSTVLGATIEEKLGFMYSNGKEHSFFDEKCKCSILSDSFVEQSKCVANAPFEEIESTLGGSFGIYLGLGAEASIEIDLKALAEEYRTIFLDTMPDNIK